MKQSIFDQLSGSWWDKEGPMRMLHSMNETRMLFIRERMMNKYQELGSFEKILNSKNILDLGCGGGILSESLALQGANIKAIDESAKLINEAKKRAKLKNLKIDYQIGSIKNIYEKKLKFDVILCLEVIEHIKDFKNFLRYTFKCLNKNGIIILSTINRTTLSFISTILIAENILKLVPKKTHNWNMYVNPEEIITLAKENKLTIDKLTGLLPLPTLSEFKWIRIKNTKANYIISLIN